VRHPNLATREHSGLVVVDLQEPLLQAVQDGPAVVAASRLLLQAAAILEVPVVTTTQYAERLGPVVPEVAELLTDSALDKMSFSCCGSSTFVDVVNSHHRRMWVACGVETHICVSQTVHDLMQRGHRVHVAADAVGSRTAANHRIGLRKLAASGAVVTSVETVIYEWLSEAGTEEFREVLKLVRQEKG
jgi:nicotinamidase-related amidase